MDAVKSTDVTAPESLMVAAAFHCVRESGEGVQILTYIVHSKSSNNDLLSILSCPWTRWRIIVHLATSCNLGPFCYALSRFRHKASSLNLSQRDFTASTRVLKSLTGPVSSFREYSPTSIPRARQNQGIIRTEADSCHCEIVTP